MEEHFNYAWLLLTFVYLLLIVVGAYAVFLYRRAYLCMKRSSMILSVVALLTALFIENAYFLIAAILEGFGHATHSIFNAPLLWVIPKIVALIGLIWFVCASLTPEHKDWEDVAERNLGKRKL
jgi:hypothetical protein